MLIDLNKYASKLYPGMAQEPEAAPRGKDYGYGTRPDGTFKGPGFLGELKRPDGGISTELSIGVNIDGKEIDIPLLVPTLTKEEIEHLLEGKELTDAIVDKAVKHAVKRRKEGRSPFYGEEDEPAK